MTTELRHNLSKLRLAAPAGRILLAVLSMGLLAPLASANCIRDFRSPGPVPTMPPAVSATAANRAMASSMIVGPIFPINSVSIVGLWNVTFTSGGQTVDVGFDAWHSDGTEILNDYVNPAEGNVCLGTWMQAGPRTYTLKHPSWSYDGAGNLVGTVVINEKVQVSADSNSYKGEYTYDIYDVDGNFLEEFTGTISATRIRA